MDTRTARRRATTSGLQAIGETRGFGALLGELRRRHPSPRTSAAGGSTGSDSRPRTGTSSPGCCPICRRPTGTLRHCPTCHADTAEGRHGWVVAEAPDDPDRRRPRQPVPCPTCTGEEGYDDARRRAAFQSLQADAGLPRNSAGWDLDSYRALAAGDPAKRDGLATAAAFARRELWRMDPSVHNLYLWGAYGVGKTGLAVGVLRARLHQGQPGAYFTLPELLDRIRRTFDRRPGDADDDADTLLRKLQDIDLLVLDDIGVERPTAWVLEKLFQLLDGRMRGERETVFTSNLDLGALTAHLGERVMERVTYQTWDVEVGGRNLRHTPALAAIAARNGAGKGDVRG